MPLSREPERSEDSPARQELRSCLLRNGNVSSRAARSCGLVAALLSLASATQAAEPTRALGIEAAAFGGFGYEMSGSHLPSARVGVGVRGGVTLDRIYLGAELTHHFGSSASSAGPQSNYDARYSATYFGAEGGFDFHLWRLLLRPYVGVGLLVARGETTVSTITVRDDHVDPFGAGGLLVAYVMDPWFVGLDLRAVVVPAERFNRTTLGGFGVLGVQL